MPGPTVEPGNQCSNFSLVTGISGLPPKHKAAMELYMLCSFKCLEVCLLNASIQKNECNILNSKSSAGSRASL